MDRIKLEELPKCAHIYLNQRKINQPNVKMVKQEAPDADDVSLDREVRTFKPKKGTTKAQLQSTSLNTFGDQKDPVYHLGDNVMQRMLSTVFGFPTFRTTNGKKAVQLCVGEQCIAQLRRRVSGSIKPGSPWHFRAAGRSIIVMIGTNDAHDTNFRSKQYKMKLYWLLRVLNKMRPHAIYLCTIPPVDKNRKSQTNCNIINLHIRTACARGKAVIVDVYKAFRLSRRQLFENGKIYPNDKGALVIAETIQQTLREF